MTSKDIERYYNKLMTKQKAIRENASYAYGKNHKINSGDARPNPDNRIAIPMGKSAVTDVVGYAGRPGEIKTAYTIINGEEKEDDITGLLSSFDEHNEEGLENSELLTTSLSLGEAWELWYTSDDMGLSAGMRTPEYIMLKNQEVVPVFTNDLKPKLEKLIRYWKAEDDTEMCDVYEALRSERWKKLKDSWIRDIAGDTVYPYETCPAIQFRTSMKDTPIFEAQKPILDALDTIVSNTQNEVDRFAGLTMLFPKKVTKETLSKIMNQLQPFFDDLEMVDANQWPQYLEKNLSGVESFYQAQCDRLERYFHKTIKVPDMSDKEFAGNASGVAIAYKLIGFEFLVSEIEVYFRRGLAKRYKLYQDIINKSTMKVDWSKYEQKIEWNRNLPVDDETKVKIAAMLQGLGFDIRIIIKYLPNSIVEGLSDEEIEEMLGGVELITEEGESLEAVEEVEAVKLNGAQVTAAKSVVADVTAGTLPRANGVAMIMSLGIPKEQAEGMVP